MPKDVAIDAPFPPLLALGSEGFFFCHFSSPYRVGDLFYHRPNLLKFSKERGVESLAAALCFLLRHSSYQRWVGLTYRELENFLRAENHLPFVREGDSLKRRANMWLEEVKKNLLFSSFKRALGESTLWVRFPFHENARVAQKLQKEIFHPFCEQFDLPWELFALEGETFVFKGGPKESWELTALKEFVCYAFQRESLQVVAEG